MSNALQIQLNSPMKDLEGCRSLMVSFHVQIINSLPKHITEGVLMNAVLNSVRKNPKLLECTASSMLSAIMCCAETGLVPDSPAQECHLIPFNKQVTWMPGYRGLIKLARQSGDIADVESAIVCEGDKFSYRLGLKPNLIHVPKLGDDRGELMYVYAILRFKDTKIRDRFEVMDKKMIDKIRAGAPGKNSDAWVKHPEEQSRKTVVKRLLKTAPFSPQLFSAIDRDNQIDTGEIQELHDTVKQLVEDATELKKPATAKLTEDLKKKAVATGSIPKEEVKPEPAPEPDVDEKKEAAIRDVLTLATDNEVVIRAKVLDKCREDNLREMAIEAIGILKEEILEDIAKAKKLQAKV